jgi:hypothetical protein
MIPLPNTERELYEYGQKIKDLYKQKNLEAGYDPSQPLQNEVTFNVNSHAGTFEIVFSLPDYWRWAENGRGPGKMPPKGSLLQWMEFKHILPSPMTLSNGRSVIPSMESLEYLIRRKIGRDGTQGSHTWEATENEIRDSLIRDVTAALNKDFEEYIKK